MQSKIMNVYNFLEKLNCIFPSQESSENFTYRINKYAELLNKAEQEANKPLDYEKMLDLMIKNYPYRNFPNYTEISRYLVYSKAETAKQDTECEYKTYEVTTKSGYTYEFVSVPPSWECSHSLSEFSNWREK